MSLFTEYLASLSTAATQTEAAQKAAKAKEQADIRQANLDLLSFREDYTDKILADAGLASDYQELLEVEAGINQEFQSAQTETEKYQLMAVESELAASLVEDKAKAIESLVSKMEAEGLLADQIEATKQGYLDSALASHNAAKASKERIAKLLSNKKIK
jgi:hypothetical protein